MNCPHCHMDITMINPSGHCDHSIYAERKNNPLMVTEISAATKKIILPMKNKFGCKKNKYYYKTELIRKIEAQEKALNDYLKNTK